MRPLATNWKPRPVGEAQGLCCKHPHRLAGRRGQKTATRRARAGGRYPRRCAFPHSRCIRGAQTTTHALPATGRPRGISNRRRLIRRGSPAEPAGTRAVTARGKDGWPTAATRSIPTRHFSVEVRPGGFLVAQRRGQLWGQLQEDLNCAFKSTGSPPEWDLESVREWKLVPSVCRTGGPR